MRRTAPRDREKELSSMRLMDVAVISNNRRRAVLMDFAQNRVVLLF
jgi:hypothetical protein